MLVKARKSYSMMYALSFIECMDTPQLLHAPKFLYTFLDDEKHSTCRL